MQKAERRLAVILRRAGGSGRALARMEVARKLCNVEPAGRRTCVAGVVVVASLIVYAASSLMTSECILKMPRDVSKIFRSPEDCSMCTDVTQVERIKNISPSDFEELYAHTGRPVIVTDGAKGWPAIGTFSFNFFKALYQRDHQTDDVDDCQFFPYKTEFHNLGQVFNMSEDRARLEPGTRSWYVGWSNCNDAAGRVLRRHYTRPYFLPENSENIALSWIFMGGPGHGAHMHVDNVAFPSWQAQITGKKKWRLMPPPECLYQCRELSVTVQPAEIIVLDTNRWYHQTFIMDEQISITIGSEFD